METRELKQTKVYILFLRQLGMYGPEAYCPTIASFSSEALIDFYDKCLEKKPYLDGQRTQYFKKGSVLECYLPITLDDFFGSFKDYDFSCRNVYGVGHGIVSEWVNDTNVYDDNFWGRHNIKFISNAKPSKNK